MISNVLRARVRLQANRHIGKLNVAQVSTLARITKAASAAGSEKLAKLALVSCKDLVGNSSMVGE